MSTRAATQTAVCVQQDAIVNLLSRALDLPDEQGDRVAMEALMLLPYDEAQSLWTGIRDDHRMLAGAIAWADDPVGVGHPVDALVTTDRFYTGEGDGDGQDDLDCVAASQYAVDQWEQHLYLSIVEAARRCAAGCRRSLHLVTR